MRQRHLFLFFACFVTAALLVAAAPVSAQSWAGKGRLQGEIRDENGKPIEGATITLRKGTERVDPKADGPKAITTNKHGKWSTLGLAGGAWGILVEKEGYAPSEGQVPVNEFAVAQPLNINLKSMATLQAAAQAEAAKAGKSMEPSGNAKAKAALEKAAAAQQAGRYAEARTGFEEGLGLLEEADPSVRLSVLRAIADTYAKEGNQAQAIATLERALQVDPTDAVSLQIIATTLIAQGKEKEAEAYIARLPQGVKIDPDTMLNTGIKAYNDKDLDGALERFNRVVQENPDLANAYYYRGLTFLGLNKSAEAKADFEKVLQLDPSFPNADEVREYIKAL
jgi:tetratricopeptide (TPR) repeat protein